MADDPSYKIGNFINEMQKMTLLDAAIKNNGLSAILAAKYADENPGAQLGSQVFTNDKYKNELAGIAAYMLQDPNFTIEKFVQEIQDWGEVWGPSCGLKAPAKAPEAPTPVVDKNIGDTSTAERIALKQNILSYSSSQSPQLATTTSSLNQQNK